MASVYPGALDDFTPLTGSEFCDTQIPQDVDLASRLNRLAAALTAIQTELGLDPSGASASVAVALSTETAARVDADTGHVAAVNPHPQYLTPASADAAYEPAGTVGAALAAAEAYVDAGRWPSVAPLSVTTPTLSSGASWASTISGPAGFRLLNIATSAPARVRVYVTVAQRDADVARPTGTDPAGDHGCLLDFVTTTGDLAWSLSPVVDGVVTGGAIPITITNLAAASAAITVTFDHVRTI